MTVLHHLHIHKAAGTSFAAFLADHVPADAVCPARRDRELLGAFDAKRHSVITGHISMPAVRDVAQEVELVTLLREPEARLVSAFHYWKRRAEEFRDKIKPGEGWLGRILVMSFGEFLAASESSLSRVTDNAMSRILAGGRFGQTRATRIAVQGPDLPANEIEARALDTLQYASFFGFAEHADAAQAVFGEMKGWPTRTPLHLNAAHEPPQISSLEQALLTERTTIDRRVYAAAQDLYRDRFGKLDPA